ncbi:hypothetical protein [Duganella sp. HH101]|uniref:hypothetical protein n=1 Tax=Duganella sp. HH101 TaxID=1781066 RepID=UPI000874F0E7|nr:hypothetical protein [Duganella sp. HH101]OEZ98974.1 lipase chaperone [Duganella sp. HH101]
MKAAAALAAVMLAAALLTVWARHAENAPAPTPTPKTGPAPAGQPAGSQAVRATASAAAYPAAAAIAPDLSLTDKQELIADFALHQLMDSFLLNRSEAELEAYLRRALPAGAANEAIQIAARYQRYLAAHDELLAAQHFTSADPASQDLNRIISWQQQRRQLRIRMLGERIALEWFGNEDAYLGQALDEWRLRSEGQAPATAGVAPEDQAAHEQHMQQALGQAIASYQRAAKAN